MQGTASEPDPQTLRHWLRLRHASDVGPRSVSSLLERFQTPAAIFAASSSALGSCGLSAPALNGLLASEPTEAIDRDLAWGAQADNHILPMDSPLYPDRLRTIRDAPVVLYVRGDPEVLATPQLAMVGSRNPSPEGKATAREFAADIAARGLTITSGLALGVDAACHAGTLGADGLTIAVAGTGPDRIYPAKHRELAERILENGAIVSEFPVGTRAQPAFFPRRNRIVSGLSLGTLVVEAAVRSGSLTTARHALEQGREIFAIPGSIHNPLARGCHQLIRQGAKLVETTDEILEELAPLLDPELHLPGRADARANTEMSSVTPDSTDSDLLACFGHTAMSIDELSQRSQLPAADVASTLLLLELHGQVRRLEGGRYQRVNT